MKQVILQSQNGDSSSAETLTQKEQVVVQSLDGESVSAVAGKEPMSVAVAEGHDDAMLNILIDSNDEGVNQLSRNELEPSQVVRPVLAVITRRQEASDRMNNNAGTTDDARDVRTEEGWTNSLTRESFLEYKMKDESLQGLWQSAKAGHPRYIIQDGLLYAKDDKCEQPGLLIVPRQYRK